MKRFCLFVALLVSVLVMSCASTKYANQVQVNDEVALILYNNYPSLYDYYMEGVLRVNSVSESHIDYDFVRYYYISYNERAAALSVHYPSVYTRYINGNIVVDDFYKYVDLESGQIRYYLSYRPIYNYYRRPYVSGRMYFRPVPPPPYHRPRVEPRKPHRTPTPPPAHRPPQTRPANPPAHQHNGNHGTRPSTPPRSHSGGHAASRPANPPRSQHATPSGGNHGGHTARPGGTNSRRR